jgi:signal peptidase II
MIKNTWKYYLIALAIVLIDQSSKLWVHFNIAMGYAGAIKLMGNWFKIHYTLNPGMAFGIQFGFKYSKLLLTFVRIVATFMIGRYIWQLARAARTPALLLWGWALILGGAVGNVIDSILYGKLLGNTPHDAPMSWFYGQVIDMFYLDIWETQLPTWLPCVGGRYLSLFPIFNIADVAILLGVVAILWAGRSAAREGGVWPYSTIAPAAQQYPTQAQQPTDPDPDPTGPARNS